jgi:hypothetical protein
VRGYIKDPPKAGSRWEKRGKNRLNRFSQKICSDFSDSSDCQTCQSSDGRGAVPKPVEPVSGPVEPVSKAETKF